jgi:hypothetical protein
VLHALAERITWRAQYQAAKALADGTPEGSATASEPTAA